jgi:hypothetical protein
LKPEGFFYVEVPNLLEVCKKIAYLGSKSKTAAERDKERIRVWTLSLYGKNRHVGDSHNWGFMPYLLCDDLQRHSFKDVTQLTEIDDMISEHYSMEAVILVRGSK